MARLEQIIVNTVELFLEYAENEDRKAQLNENELRTLLTKEIQSEELKDKFKPNDIEEAMKLLDKNHDGEVNFREFCSCVSSLAKTYYTLKKKSAKKDKEEAAA